MVTTKNNTNSAKAGTTQVIMEGSEEI